MQTRIDVEAAAMQAVHAICPQHTPSLELYDPQTCTLAMQFLDGFIKLQDAIHSQQQCPWAFSHLAELMAGYLHGTSAAALGDAAVEEAAARFANTDIVKANIAVVFDDPWDAGCLSNRWPSELDDGVMKMRWAEAEPTFALFSICEHSGMACTPA